MFFCFCQWYFVWMLTVGADFCLYFRPIMDNSSVVSPSCASRNNAVLCCPSQRWPTPCWTIEPHHAGKYLFFKKYENFLFTLMSFIGTNIWILFWLQWCVVGSPLIKITSIWIIFIIYERQKSRVGRACASPHSLSPAASSTSFYRRKKFPRSRFQVRILIKTDSL